MGQLLVFSDLDGTLLDHATYSFDAARQAIDSLRRKQIPLILTTSKTRLETEMWRERLGNNDPFIFENGAAFVLPPGKTTVYGDPYADLVAVLTAASNETECRIRAFHEMSVDEVAHVCDLPHDQAALARIREYDEPFEILDRARAWDLLRAIEGRGKRWTRGGRFYHIIGDSDKARAVTAVKDAYENPYTIGLGDGWNDVEFLKLMDEPVIIRSPRAEQLRAVLPQARVTNEPGPAGWNEAILQMAVD